MLGSSGSTSTSEHQRHGRADLGELNDDISTSCLLLHPHGRRGRVEPILLFLPTHHHCSSSRPPTVSYDLQISSTPHRAPTRSSYTQLMGFSKMREGICKPGQHLTRSSANFPVCGRRELVGAGDRPARTTKSASPPRMCAHRLDFTPPSRSRRQSNRPVGQARLDRCIEAIPSTPDHCDG